MISANSLILSYLFTSLSTAKSLTTQQRQVHPPRKDMMSDQTMSPAQLEAFEKLKENFGQTIIPQVKQIHNALQQGTPPSAEEMDALNESLQKLSASCLAECKLPQQAPPVSCSKLLRFGTYQAIPFRLLPSSLWRARLTSWTARNRNRRNARRRLVFYVREHLDIFHLSV